MTLDLKLIEDVNLLADMRRSRYSEDLAIIAYYDNIDLLCKLAIFHDDDSMKLKAIHFLISRLEFSYTNDISTRNIILFRSYLTKAKNPKMRKGLCILLTRIAILLSKRKSQRELIIKDLIFLSQKETDETVLYHAILSLYQLDEKLVIQKVKDFLSSEKSEMIKPFIQGLLT